MKRSRLNLAYIVLLVACAIGFLAVWKGEMLFGAEAVPLVKRIVLEVICICAGMVSAAMAVDAISTGVITVQPLGDVHRNESPIWFWGQVVFYFIVAVAVSAFGVVKMVA